MGLYSRNITKEQYERDRGYARQAAEEEKRIASRNKVVKLKISTIERLREALSAEIAKKIASTPDKKEELVADALALIAETEQTFDSFVNQHA